jgi:predicted  nucleic acid-binding Zn-ribbon protein
MKQKLPVILLLISVIAAGFLGFSSWKLTDENKTLRKDLTYSKTKAELLQKKFVEQKRMAEELLRVKSNLEGQQRNSQADIEKEKQKLTAENTALKAQNADLKKKLDGMISERDGVRKDLAGLKEVHQKTVQDLDKLADSKKAIEAKLKKTDEQLDMCRTKNAELVSIGNDLVVKYKNKGVVSAIASKEPLTQIKKVELEKMTLEYADKIKELKIENKSAGK